MSAASGGLVLGVDGGNSKTIALVAAADGTILGAGRAGASDVYNAATPGDAIAEIAAASAQALAAAGTAPGALAAAAFSLAGADWPEDFALLQERLPPALRLSVPALVVNDAIGALRCGIDDAVGVSVVCGTGGAIGARNAQGEVFHIGFWPHAMGGAAMAQQGLDAVFRAGLGTGPSTALQAAALRRYGEPDELALLHAFTRREPPPPRRAGFVVDVLDAAEAGDPVAAEIVAANGRALGRAAQVSATRVDLPPGHPVVLAGGVLRHGSPLLVDTILSRIPDGRAVPAHREPAVAALLWAFEQAGLQPDPARLVASTPDAATFATMS